MATPDSATRKRPITASIRQRIERGGERLWRLDDFRDLPFTAVAQALSRLTRDGAIERLSKGVYYRNRQTVLPLRMRGSLITSTQITSAQTQQLIADSARSRRQEALNETET